MCVGVGVAGVGVRWERDKTEGAVERGGGGGAIQLSLQR